MTHPCNVKGQPPHYKWIISTRKRMHCHKPTARILFSFDRVFWLEAKLQIYSAVNFPPQLWLWVLLQQQGLIAAIILPDSPISPLASSPCHSYSIESSSVYITQTNCYDTLLSQYQAKGGRKMKEANHFPPSMFCTGYHRESKCISLFLVTNKGFEI